MAKLALEPDRPPEGPGSQGPRASPSSGQPPRIRAFNTWDSAGIAWGKLKPQGPRLRLRGPPSPNHFSERVLNLGTSPPCLSLRPSEPSRLLFTCCLRLGESLEKRWALLAGGETQSHKSGTLASRQPRALSWTEPRSSSGHEAGGRGWGEGGDWTAKALPGIVKPMGKGRSRGTGPFGCRLGTLSLERSSFSGGITTVGLSRGEGSPSQSKDQGGEEELRLWGEPDLGSSLALLPSMRF